MLTSRIWTGPLRLLALGVLLGLGGAELRAQEGAVKAPEWKHAMDLKGRKAGEKDGTDKPQKYGVEVYLDPNTGKLVYVCETGSIAVVAGTASSNNKAPEWKHAMEFRVRKADEKDFTKDTKKYGLE